MALVQHAEVDESKMPTEEMFIEMGKFNDSLIQAGILLAADGLQPSAKGARLVFSPDGPMTVVDGPFTETKELVGGYWIIQARSKEEAIERFRTCPAFVGQIELRPMQEIENFEAHMTTDEGRATLQAEQEFRDRPTA